MPVAERLEHVLKAVAVGVVVVAVVIVVAVSLHLLHHLVQEHHLLVLHVLGVVEHGVDEPVVKRKGYQFKPFFKIHVSFEYGIKDFYQNTIGKKPL